MELNIIKITNTRYNYCKHLYKKIINKYKTACFKHANYDPTAFYNLLKNVTTDKKQIILNAVGVN